MKSFTSKKELKRFGILFSIPSLFLVGWMLYIFGVNNFKLWTLCLGIFLLGLSIFRPFIFFYIYRFWIYFRDLLVWLISKIILVFLFIMVLIPFALIMRILKYDPLRMNKSLSKSYRETKQNIINLKSIF